jgi:hypothetical protein
VPQPSVRTRTWYHTGAFFRGGKILRGFAADYFVNAVLPEAELPDAVIEAPAGYALTPDEAREAARACKGMMLRQEVYADDGSPLAANPYTVAESNCHIRLLQPQQDNRYAVFLAHASETISYHYERNPADPRISHELNTVMDELGNVVEQASIAYGRVTADASLLADVLTPGRERRNRISAGRTHRCSDHCPAPCGDNIGSASMAREKCDAQAQSVLATRKPVKLRRSIGSIPSR